MRGTKPYNAPAIFALLRHIEIERRPPEIKDNLQQPLNLWGILEHCWQYSSGDRFTAIQCRQAWESLVSIKIKIFPLAGSKQPLGLVGDDERYRGP